MKIEVDLEQVPVDKIGGEYMKLVNTYCVYVNGSFKRVYEVLMNGKYHQLTEREYSNLLKTGKCE